MLLPMSWCKADISSLQTFTSTNRGTRTFLLMLFGKKGQSQPTKKKKKPDKILSCSPCLSCVSQAASRESVFASTSMSVLFIMSSGVNFFGLVFAGMLAKQHIKQVMTNMTTNEISNQAKYDHFKRVTRSGQVELINPFDVGTWKNAQIMLTKSSRRRVYHKDGRITLVE
eukprot:m.102009 g.102009  ORF g.102009 m.102009 type:complete len:170 (-) comp14997_c0_seq2:737-1246(-)